VKVYPSYRLLQNLNQPGISDVPEYGKNIVYDPAQGTGYGMRGCTKPEPVHHGVSMARIGEKHRMQNYMSRFS
jgi:hypothetical protein